VKRTWESAGREAVSLAARAPVRASVTEFAASTAVEFDKQAYRALLLAAQDSDPLARLRKASRGGK